MYTSSSVLKYLECGNTDTPLHMQFSDYNKNADNIFEVHAIFGYRNVTTLNQKREGNAGITLPLPSRPGLHKSYAYYFHLLIYCA
jgi:hypothetical protein